MDTTDGDIITQVLAGDRELFHVLVQRHSAPLWGTVRASLANVEDAHDVIQETWLRALQRLETLRDPARLRAWLVTIALNQVRQRLRRRTPPTESNEALAQEPDPEASSEARVARDEELERLRARVAELPPRQREVVDLRLNHGLSHAEIAVLLDIREDASRANYYQALRRLRASFGASHEERPR